MELRPYQLEAKNAVFSQWESGIRNTLLVLPTGTGKTIVFAKVTEDCVRHGHRVLILAHRGELLDQAADKIHKATGLGVCCRKSRTVLSGKLVSDCCWVCTDFNEREKAESIPRRLF